MSEQPDALRLADHLDSDQQGIDLGAEGMGWGPSDTARSEAAAELRRLHGRVTALEQAGRLALEALEEIALAGMSGTGMESEDAMRDWHARKAWNFIGIAARSLTTVRQALGDKHD